MKHSDRINAIKEDLQKGHFSPHNANADIHFLLQLVEELNTELEELKAKPTCSDVYYRALSDWGLGK